MALTPIKSQIPKKGEPSGSPLTFITGIFEIDNKAAVNNPSDLALPDRLFSAQGRYIKDRPFVFLPCLHRFCSFMPSTNSMGFAVISIHAGLNPLTIALRTDLIFDHAAQ